MPSKIAEPLVVLKDDAVNADLEEFKANQLRIKELEAQIAELESQQEALKGRIIPVLKEADKQMVRVGDIVYRYTKTSRTTVAWKQAFDAAIKEVNATAARVMEDARDEVTKVTEYENITMKVGGKRQADLMDILKGAWGKLTSVFRSLTNALSKAADNLEALGEPPTSEGAEAAVNPLAAMDAASTEAANSFLTEYREHRAKVAEQGKASEFSKSVRVFGRPIKRTRYID